MTDTERRIALESMFDTDGWKECYVPSIQKRRESLVLRLINDKSLADPEFRALVGEVRALDSFLRVSKEVALMRAYLTDEQTA